MTVMTLEPPLAADDTEAVAEELSSLDTMVRAMAQLTRGVLARALRLGEASGAEWAVYVKAVAAGRTAEVHAARARFAERIGKRLELARRSIGLARTAGEMEGEPLKEADKLREVILGLERLQADVIGRWSTPEDLEELAVKWFPLPSAKLEQLAGKYRPPQSWYEEAGKPF